MTKKILIAMLLASLSMFIWGALYWMNPLASRVFQFPADDAVAQAALSAQFPNNGTYWVPGNMEDSEAWTQRHKAGPIALITITHGGKEPMGASVMALGFLHMVGYAVLLTLLLGASKAVAQPYLSRLRFCAWVGLLVAFFTEVGAMIWFYQPFSYSLLLAGYAFTVTLAGGAVLAVWVREPKNT